MKNFNKLILLFLGIVVLTTSAYAEVGQSFKIPSQSGEFAVRMSVIPNDAVMNGVVGLGPDTANAWGDFNCMVRFNETGLVDVRNSGSYTADVEFQYAAGTKYYLQINGNTTSKLYSVRISKEDGTEVLLASDYSFRESNYTGTLDFLSVFINDIDTPPSSFSIFDVQIGTVVNTDLHDNFTMQLESPANGKFAVKLRATPSSLPMNGAVGLSKLPVEQWGHYNVIVLFAPDSTIKVRNGTAYEALNKFKYEAGLPYTIYISGNTDSSSYDVSLVTLEGEEIILAEDYAFRLNNPGDTLKYLNQRINQDAADEGTPGSYIAVDGIENGYMTIDDEGFIALATKMEKQTDPFSLTFSATPSTDNVNAVISFNDTSDIAWGDMSAIVRFNEAGVIDARNGSAYARDVEVPYVKGQTYLFTVDFNVPANTYTVIVKTDLYSEADTIGSNYAFRKSPVTSLGYISYKGLPSMGTLTVSDVAMGQQFTVDSSCVAPSIDDIADQEAASGEGEITITLSGISSGNDEASEELGITTTSSHPEYISASVVLGTDNDASLTLEVYEVSEATDVTISVRVFDDCDVENRGGVSSSLKSFVVSIAGPTKIENRVLKSPNIYPNPVGDIMTVSNASDVTRIEMINVLGNIILPTFNMGDEQLKINMNYLNPGPYLIRCFSADGELSTKMIVKQ